GSIGFALAGGTCGWLLGASCCALVREPGLPVARGFESQGLPGWGADRSSRGARRVHWRMPRHSRVGWGRRAARTRQMCVHDGLLRTANPSYSDLYGPTMIVVWLHKQDLDQEIRKPAQIERVDE